MKKTMKKALISVFGASMIASAVSTAVYAETVDSDNCCNAVIRIEGIEECLYYDTVAVQMDSENITAADVLKFADSASDAIEITWTESDYGAYISAVNEESEASFGAWDGWMFQVNGESPSVGMSSYTVSDGDEIVLYYGYMDETTSPQYPEMSFDRKTGILKFTSMDVAGYDSNWNPTYAENPVTDMNVTVGEYSFVTDSNGEINLAEKELAAQEYEISYSKTNSAGAPLVLRSAPGLTITVGCPFGDVDCSGMVNALDASMILTAYANAATEKPTGLNIWQEEAANVDGNSSIDALDASLVLGYYAYTATGGKESLKDYLKDNLAG